MLQIRAALFYYNLGQTLLQIAVALLLQIWASAVTNWGSYCKLEQPLLENRAAITNWGKMYYKLGQVLQIREIITNWSITASTEIHETRLGIRKTTNLYIIPMFPFLYSMSQLVSRVEILIVLQSYSFNYSHIFNCVLLSCHMNVKELLARNRSNI